MEALSLMEAQATAQPSWRHWFAQHGPRLLLFARQQTRTESDAEDVLQEAFVRLWRRHEGEEAPPPALFFTAIRHTAIDLARKHDRRTAREEKAHETQEPVTWFERRLEAEERQDQLLAAVRELPRPQQDVLTLKVWGELTFDDIARVLEIPANTAASRYRYALNGLRKQLATPANDA